MLFFFFNAPVIQFIAGPFIVFVTKSPEDDANSTDAWCFAWLKIQEHTDCTVKLNFLFSIVVKLSEKYFLS